MNDDYKENEDEIQLNFFQTQDELLQSAEKKAAKDKPKIAGSLSAREVQKLLHSLRVHQIELEMQNEELRKAQIEMQKSRERYFDLYELAPVGYFCMNEKGIIIESNLTLSIILGELRSQLTQYPFFTFIHPDSRALFFRNLHCFFENGTPDLWELHMEKKGPLPFWVRLDLTKAQDPTGQPVARGVLTNITDMKAVEYKLREKIKDLQIIIHTGKIQDN